MKKFAILLISFLTISLTGCSQNISNLDVQTLNEKAAEYMKQGDYENAIARLKSAIDLNSSFPQSHFNLGIAYYENKDFEEAIEAFNEAIKLKSDFTDAYYSRAIAYEELAYIIIAGEKEDKNKDNDTKVQQNEEDENTELSDEDKKEIVEYLKKSKEDFEKYINLNKTTQDAEQIKEKITQIEDTIKKYENDGEE